MLTLSHPEDLLSLLCLVVFYHNIQVIEKLRMWVFMFLLFYIVHCLIIRIRGWVLILMENKILSESRLWAQLRLIIWNGLCQRLLLMMICQRWLSIVFRVSLLLSPATISKLLFEFRRNGDLLAPNEVEIMIPHLILPFIWSSGSMRIHNFQLSLYLRLFNLLMNLSIIFLY